MGKLLFLGLLMTLFACRNKGKSLEEFSISTVNGVNCKIYYIDGVLREIRHTKKNQKENALNSYTFYKDGSISTIEKVINDTILSTTRYYPNGKIKIKKHDLDLNPNDTTLLLHGEFSEYYETGALKSAGRFENGEKRDTFKYFDEKGKLLQSEIFDEYLK